MLNNLRPVDSSVDIKINMQIVFSRCITCSLFANKLKYCTVHNSTERTKSRLKTYKILNILEKYILKYNTENINKLLNLIFDVFSCKNSLIFISSPVQHKFNLGEMCKTNTEYL